MVLTSGELKCIADLLATWRERLADLSWFMRCLNEPIARMANAEDHCTGRFWEGRFKSQALLEKVRRGTRREAGMGHERALLACMAYVDLNPIRAAMAKIPEESDFTSVQERILHPESSILRPFTEQSHNNASIPISLRDYLELVDWGGREIKHNKRGYIPAHAPPILIRLKMGGAPVLNYLSRADQSEFGALGPVSKLRSKIKKTPTLHQLSYKSRSGKAVGVFFLYFLIFFLFPGG